MQGGPELDGPYRGGGGGGAGAAGDSSNNSNTGAGNGGNGTTAFSSWLSATSSGENSNGTFYIAGGGGGGGYWNEYGFPRPNGGLGGGAKGSSRQDSTGSQTAMVNTGGGGSGSSDSPTGNGSSGASGLVIIRYPDSFSLPSSTTATTYTSGGYRYVKFTASGNVTF